MAEIIPFLLLGIFSGFIAGFLGVGGGLIIVPVLLYLLSADVEQAQLMHTVIATSLIIIVFTSISSVWAHHKHGAIRWHYFKKLTPTILLGAVSGAMLTQFMSFDFMRLFFAFFELIVAVIMFISMSSSKHIDSLKQWIWHVIGYMIGLISAIVGVGGGTMTMPLLSYNQVNIKNAIATSAAVGLPIALAGSLGFMVASWHANGNALGFIHFDSFISIVLMSILFAPLGAKATHRANDKKLKKTFAVFLAVLGISVLIF